MTTPAGQRNKRVTIQRKVVTKSPSNGEELVAWVEFAKRWARFQGLRGREFFAAEQTQSSVDYRVNLLKPLAITRDMRIVHKDLIVDIIEIIDNGDELELMCSTGIRNAI